MPIIGKNQGSAGQALPSAPMMALATDLPLMADKAASQTITPCDLTLS